MAALVVKIAKMPRANSAIVFVRSPTANASMIHVSSVCALKKVHVDRRPKPTNASVPKLTIRTHIVVPKMNKSVQATGGVSLFVALANATFHKVLMNHALLTPVNALAKPTISSSLENANLANATTMDLYHRNAILRPEIANVDRE